MFFLPHFYLGLQGRGASASIASPGISAIFGSGTSTGRPATSGASAFTAAGATASPHKPVTEKKIMSRYTPTFQSNAFAHSQYETPVKNVESAALRTLKTTGTSIEDYGRRNIDFNRPSSYGGSQATGFTVAPTLRRDVLQDTDPTLPYFTNQNMASMKKMNLQTEKSNAIAFEQQRLAEIKKHEDTELMNKRVERDANQKEMSMTLQDIRAKKQAEWDAKKYDKSNFELSQKLERENQESSMKARQDRLSATEAYRADLNRKREEAIQLNIQGKINDRELARRLNGLTFECYQRDPQMKQETLNTGQFQKLQISDINKRKQLEREDFVKPPEVFYTDKELEVLRQEAEDRQREVKSHYVENAKTQLNQHFSRKSAESMERLRNIEEEQGVHKKMRQLEDQEKMYQRRARQDRQREMNSTLTSIENKKRQEWESKKNDKSNKIESEKLNEQISHMARENYEDVLRQKQAYNQDLTHMRHGQRAKIDQDFKQDREEEANAKGFQFECYQRDPAMKMAAKETGTFLKTQQKFEKQRNEYEKEALKAPPPSLMTTDNLIALEQEAMNQNLDKRLSLKNIMHSQYVGTKAMRDAQIAAERQTDAMEAARTAEINAQIERQEKQFKQDFKKNYGQYLNSQKTDDQKRKEIDEQYRRFDPHVEKLIQENAKPVHKPVKIPLF